MKYRKKPVVIEATRWWANGDHPEDESYIINGGNGEDFLSEGKVVRRYNHPGKSGSQLCQVCHVQLMRDHGWIDTLEGGHTVCPGDFIITGVQGEKYPCKPDIFEATYEAVE